MDDTEQIIEREPALLRPEVRRDRAAVLALLTPDFAEVDATGRIWDAEGIAEALATGTDGYVLPEVADLATTRLAPGVQLLTYRDSRNIHGSIWVRPGSGEWLLRFHQQTRSTAAS